MVGHEHDLAGREGRVDRAAGVGQHDDRGAGRRGRAHRMDHRHRIATLVEVGAADEGQHVDAVDGQRADDAGMPLDRRRGKAGQVARDQLGTDRPHALDATGPPGPEDDGDLVARDAGCRGDGVGRPPGIGRDHGPSTRSSATAARQQSW